MDPQEILSRTQEAMHVRRVFGEAIQAGNITIVPAAIVGGAGSGGKASDEGGAGFGVKARPAGAFVIKNGDVSWRPAVNLNQVIAGGQIVAIVALLAIRPVLAHWRRSRAEDTERVRQAVVP